MSKKFLVLLLVLGFAGIASGAGTVSGNMGQNEMSLLATDVAGIMPQDHWNNVPIDWWGDAWDSGGSGGAGSNLLDDDGNGTTLDVSWTSRTTWHSTGNGTATGDAKMMYGYVDATWGDTPVTVTLSQIPYAEYDVYVYFGTGDAGATGTVTDGTTLYGITNAAANPGGDGFQYADYLQVTSTEGQPSANWARFRHTQDTVTITVNKTGEGGMGIFGWQVVSDPLASATKAWGPTPVDEATNIALNTDLSWYVPIDANVTADTDWTYKVYFDTDSTFAATTPITIGPVAGSRLTATNAQIGGALDGGTYFWRVDSVEPNTPPVTTTGDVWTFTAGCTLPTLIDPNNTYTEVVEVDVDLVWSSDPLAITHNVVITPDGGSAVTLVNKTSPFNPYADAGITMEWNKQYTWQIKEYDAGSVLLATGPVWQFKVRALVCDSSMTADIDGSDDCIVNLADFAAMASQWLDCKWNDGGKASPCP